MSIAYYYVDLEEILEKLRRFFADRRVNAVILFGSALRRRIVRDIDLLIHTEEELSLRDLASLSSKLEEILGVPVDLVPLSQAYPQIIVKALAEGVPVIVRDWNPLVEAYKKAIGILMDVENKVRHHGRTGQPSRTINQQG